MSEIARLGVFGRPVAHSRSPEIHQLFAAQTGIPLSYEKILVPEGQFNRLATAFLQTGRGFNITAPCKQEAFEFAGQCSPAAQAAGAVNTISINAAGLIRGDNTDGPGLVRDMTRNLGWQLQGRKLLVLGAGGAVSGVLAALLDEQPGEIHLHNRTHARAAVLAQKIGDARLSAPPAPDTAYDIVINGRSGAGGLSDLGNIIHGGSCCYDMTYHLTGTHDMTPFNRWCLEQADCVTADGLGMLVEQAALAFTIWFGQEVRTALSTVPVISALRQTPGTA